MRWFAWCVAVCGVAWSGFILPALAVDGDVRFMRVHGQSLPPYGFVEFCRTHKRECTASAKASMQRFDAGPEKLSELDRINRRVNAAVQPATDMEVYGVEEYWTFPGTRGDCEDYVILKRHLLMKMGWPSNSLLITVVRDEKGEGHAVLTARTQQGDFILDNKVNDVRLWRDTPYKYIMRQSYLNPMVWVSLDPRATASPEAIAGLRRKQ
ncbi:MAG: transglutaminase-like cysteine peptidase [Hyphomicrobiaceae bacterium]|nr:transglutaminase-like cysteine peptidase [Hyphomicrobiaceae bacterium]